MAELTTLARPYAKAAFESGLGDNSLGHWSSVLATAASVSSEQSVTRLLTDPSLSTDSVVDSFVELLGDDLDTKARNFIRLLAENKRLVLLPAISALFHALKANQERSITVEITTAFEVSSENLDNLAQGLKGRLAQDVSLSTTVDNSLIGGAVVRAGDTVIDNSVRGKLVKLVESMNS
ncbi:MAG: F0F1 ATP synthase subunit delta [Gammaproteobacteria bacterium]|nr:F0F1 ATP synthase subunit delta [Gammaproteobacteria bacterium]HBW83218.1 F0F1 ATP synthase subunit delta [Gammaproteobacteria bacterium]|tara:strand:- start:1744 stop:2280 length:537 start_codon:yes stop_codon:yes gene_type:complete